MLIIYQHFFALTYLSLTINPLVRLESESSHGQDFAVSTYVDMDTNREQ
jgi:hypothetical protein